MDKINKAAARFREVRAHLGVTQQKMANLLNLKRNTVAKIETGHAQPSARTVSDLEELFIKSNYGSVRALLDKVEPISLKEDPAPYGDVATLRKQIQLKIEEVMAAAGEDRMRLGWVLLQLNEHVTPQKHWQEADPRIVAKLEQLKRDSRRPGSYDQGDAAESA